MKKHNSQGMVDISRKRVTKRMAVASAQVHMSTRAFRKFMSEGSPKGDAFETARCAGLLAAKTTPHVFPHCHPLELNKVKIIFEIKEKASMITMTAEVHARARTGVEMEALHAVSVAALAFYDMMKWSDKGMTITDVMLLEKKGGKGGTFRRKRG